MKILSLKRWFLKKELFLSNGCDALVMPKCVQGRKDKEPAFTMRAIEDGKYVVDFHAQLSSLQAFSICVALLHAAEASTGAGRERSEQMLQSDSLRVFAEEEMKHLIDTISEEEKFKSGKMEDALPSFVLNPPFSPISRV